MIRRAPRPKRNYTTIPNAAIEDNRLSFKALGLLVYLLSKPDNWTVNRDHLATTHTDGTDSVRTALRELRAAGYITEEAPRGPDGRLQGRVAVVHDSPQEQPPTGGPPDRRETHQAGEPRVVTTEVEQPLSEQGVVTPREQLTLVPAPTPAALPAPAHVLGSDRDVWFARFWELYPRKVAKGAARTAWAAALRRGKARPEEIIAGAERYAADPNRDPSYTAHPATWLNAERWGDEPEPDRTAPAPRAPTTAMGATVGHLRKLRHDLAAGPPPARALGDGR